MLMPSWFAPHSHDPDISHREQQDAARRSPSCTGRTVPTTPPPDPGPCCESTTSSFALTSGPSVPSEVAHLSNDDYTLLNSANLGGRLNRLNRRICSRSTQPWPMTPCQQVSARSRLSFQLKPSMSRSTQQAGTRLSRLARPRRRPPNIPREDPPIIAMERNKTPIPQIPSRPAPL